MDEQKRISMQYLRANPDHIFVFGDNRVRVGKKGAAILRDEPNTYGFITKRYPSTIDSAHFMPGEYRPVFKEELEKLVTVIEANPDKTYLISKLGAGLANRFKIYEKIIRPGLKVLEKFENVKFCEEL